MTRLHTHQFGDAMIDINPQGLGRVQVDIELAGVSLTYTGLTLSAEEARAVRDALNDAIAEAEPGHPPT